MTCDSPIVLDEQSRSPVVDVASRVAGKKAAVGGRPGKEILDRRRSNAAVRRSECVATEKLEAAACSAVSATVKAVAMLFDTKFDGVLSNRA